MAQPGPDTVFLKYASGFDLNTDSNRHLPAKAAWITQQDDASHQVWWRMDYFHDSLKRAAVKQIIRFVKARLNNDINQVKSTCVVSVN